MCEAESNEGKLGNCEARYCGETGVWVLPRKRGGKVKRPVEWQCESCYYDEEEELAEAREREYDDYLERHSWEERQSDLYDIWAREY